MSQRNGSRLGKKADLPFYSYDALWSRNGVYNFLVGARGLGKTYGAKKHAIRRFINHGEQFIYLRRYETELNLAKVTLFGDLNAEFPDWEFKAKGDELLLRPAGTDDQWQVCGYAIALSKSQQKKSVSYHNVTLIIFDEFIIEKGALHYLPGEARTMNDFYSTVDRYRDKTRVLFLANSISIMNPYFLEYHIEPEPGQEWISKHSNFIVCHFPDDAAFADGVYKTRFGTFIKGTDYADYAVGSFFTDNGKTLVRKKSETAQYGFTLKLQSGEVSVWWDYVNGELCFYLQAKQPKETQIWVLDPTMMREGYTLVERNELFLQRLRSAYAVGNAWFDSPTSRNIYAESLKR